MTSSLHSSSNGTQSADQSQAFSRLHEKVRKWIWDQGWTELRDAQEEAVQPILSGSTDVLIAAATATGKTEAAFLPICSRLIGASDGSVRALYVSPLKALINDQFERLSHLCEHLDISVFRWHGDVPQGQKKGVLERPSGLLLITPESLEAIFVNHGTRIATLFRLLAYVVIDEVHSFIGTERGRQLQSLLHRLELAIGRQVPRIGLSATLGDMNLAQDFLRPGQTLPSRLIVSKRGNQALELQVRGYLIREPEVYPTDSSSTQRSGTGELNEGHGGVLEICNHLFDRLRGKTNLIFTNRRAEVEIYADTLRRLGEQLRVPNEFWPHHGSLSKNLREDVEAILKDKSRPSTAVCTTTLEMGIDIGTMDTTAQIGAPPSVTALRQRLGRSGRRGEPAVLRIYVQEQEIESETAPQDRLRAELVQAIAMVELLLKSWCEPPLWGRLHLSTLIQQLLSLIAQYGGIRPVNAWRVLCESGPFKEINQKVFAELLRSLGNYDLINQAEDGALILSFAGEQVVNHYSFYTAFNTPEEYQLISSGQVLGTLPIDYPLFAGVYVIFAGRRWEVLNVDIHRRTVELKPAKGGRPPRFGGSRAMIHDRIRQEMLLTYKSRATPVFIDDCAKALLAEGRENFHRFGLSHQSFLQNGKDALVFLWRGDRITNTLMVQFQADGLKVTNEGLALNVSDVREGELRSYLSSLLIQNPTDPLRLASTVTNKLSEKYECYLSEPLLNMEYAARSLDVHGAWKAISELLNP